MAPQKHDDDHISQRQLDRRLEKLCGDMNLREIRFAFRPSPTERHLRYLAIGIINWHSIMRKAREDGFPNPHSEELHDKPAALGQGPTINAALVDMKLVSWTPPKPKEREA